MMTCSWTDIEPINPVEQDVVFYLLAVLTHLFSVSPSHKIFFLNSDLTLI